MSYKSENPFLLLNLLLVRQHREREVHHASVIDYDQEMTLVEQ
jgi:hypothetical protein